MTPGALNGIKVLDLSSVVCGPLGAQLLGDMGADVIKVEAPAGDLARSVGPARHPGMAALYLNCNRNKRSLVLDLKHPDGAATLRRLAGQADVLLHSIRSESAARIGLDYATLSAGNPGLIYCHVGGFGDEGTYGGLPAFDDIIQAASGCAELQTIYAGEPRYFPMLIADKTAGVFAALAIAGALVARGASGLGQEVKVPMFETMAAFTTVEHLWGETFDPPIGEMGYGSIRAGTRKPYRTADGYIAIVPYTDAQWARFFAVVGRPELIDDPRFATLSARVVHNAVVFGTLGELMAARTTAAWITALRAADIPAMPVQGLPDLLTDPHLQSVDFWEMHDHRTEGRIRQARVPYSLGRTPGAVARLAPGLGEHSREILAEFGFAETDIEALVAAGVVAEGKHHAG